MTDQEKTASRKRIGLLVPSTNTTMEQDLQRALAGVATVHTARMHLVETTEKDESVMLDEYLPGALEDIATLEPDVVVFGCTSAGALRGPDYDRELCQRIQNRTGAPTISTINAAATALKESGHPCVSVLTPYIEELSSRVRASIESAGVEVIDIKGLGILRGLDLSKPTPSEIAKHAIDLIRATKPPMLFISCTDFRSLEAVKEIEEATGTPVMTSNLAVIRAVENELYATV
jgi:maleate isomerase